MYSDITGEGYGGYLANDNDELIAKSEIFGNWISQKMKQSSTWRELETVNCVLHQHLNHVQGKTVEIVSINKNVSHILQVGSKQMFEWNRIRNHGCLRKKSKNVATLSRSKSKQID